MHAHMFSGDHEQHAVRCHQCAPDRSWQTQVSANKKKGGEKRKKKQAQTNNLGGERAGVDLHRYDTEETPHRRPAASRNEGRGIGADEFDDPYRRPSKHLRRLRSHRTRYIQSKRKEKDRLRKTMLNGSWWSPK